MPRRPDPDRLRHAKLMGSAMGVRDQVLLADPALVARQRDELPQLWTRIDDLIAYLEEG